MADKKKPDEITPWPIMGPIVCPVFEPPEQVQEPEMQPIDAITDEPAGSES